VSSETRRLLRLSQLGKNISSSYFKAGNPHNFFAGVLLSFTCSANKDVALSDTVCQQ
jgi:hypothetical protein